jgi:hypothetical protein
MRTKDMKSMPMRPTAADAVKRPPPKKKPKKGY